MWFQESISEDAFTLIRNAKNSPVRRTALHELPYCEMWIYRRSANEPTERSSAALFLSAADYLLPGGK
jgi:hypothetical protein